MRHNISDWLALHDLDASLCRQILSAAAAKVTDLGFGPVEATPGSETVDPEVAWFEAVEAVRALFPAQRSVIDSTFANTARVRVSYNDQHPRALTLDHGDAGYPTIFYDYRGSASDLFVVVHEFAHALQIVASGGTFATPVVREVCAFVGEIALLSRMKDADQFQHASKAWLRDNRKYLIADGRDLDLALDDPHVAYRYRWNYPVARYLAIEIFGQWTPAQIWLLFEGKLSVREILRDLKTELVPGPDS